MIPACNQLKWRCGCLSGQNWTSKVYEFLSQVQTQHHCLHRNKHQLYFLHMLLSVHHSPFDGGGGNQVSPSSRDSPGWQGHRRPSMSGSAWIEGRSSTLSTQQSDWRWSFVSMSTTSQGVQAFGCWCTQPAASLSHMPPTHPGGVSQQPVSNAAFRSH